MKKRYSFNQNIENIIQQVTIDFNNPQIELDEQLYFYDAKYLRHGLQNSITRFKENCIKFPSEFILPCLTVDNKFLGTVKIKEVLVSTIDDLTDEDAQSCSESKQDLIKTFSRIHQYQLQPEDYISIYKLSVFFEKA